jgi:hypothetical protein
LYPLLDTSVVDLFILDPRFGSIALTINRENGRKGIPPFFSTAYADPLYPRREVSRIKRRAEEGSLTMFNVIIRPSRMIRAFYNLTIESTGGPPPRTMTHRKKKLASVEARADKILP